jgi:two-component system OmpR family sensor kinase
MRIRSIGTRLTFWYSSLLTLTFLLLAGAAYGLLAYSLSQDVDAALSGVAKVMAERARAERATFFPSDVDELFSRFFGFSPPNRYFEMLDPRGQHDPRQPRPRSGKLPISAQAMKRASQGLPAFETVETNDHGPIRILTLPVMKGRLMTGLVQVGMSLETMNKTRRRFLLIMAAMLPVALLLAGGGGWLLARHTLKPVNRITEAAHRISSERLDERLDETGTGDELDRLAQTLNNMLERLDAAFRQIRQFSADASHELQTPLTILKGELEVALRSPRRPEEYQQILKSGLEEINRIAHLVGGLLLLARADAGVLRMDRQPVDLKRLLNEVYEQVKVLADSRSVNISLGSLEPVSIPGDYEHLRRLLLNLVDNGVKYTAAGGRLTLSLQSEGGWASMRVSDTGMGLSREEQARVFQRFFRAAQARSQGGESSGLGLCIAQSIAEAHGGRIEVESSPGKGSTFTVFLPIRPRE